MSSAGASSRPHYVVWLSDGPVYCHDCFECQSVLQSAHEHGLTVHRVTGWILGGPQAAVAQFPLDITVLTDTVDKDIPY